MKNNKEKTHQIAGVFVFIFKKGKNVFSSHPFFFTLLKMRLTADLINNSPSYMNAVNDRELYLRNNKIQVIENLGASKASFIFLIIRIFINKKLGST
jgi:hypothetical protein